MEILNGFREESVRTLSIEQWLSLNEEGVDLPVYIKLHGSSMSPLVRMLRDVVCIRPLRREPVPGDIVLFRSGMERYVVHRVFRIDGDRILTFGDNCAHPDAWNTRKNILGLVTHVKRDEKMVCVDNVFWRKSGLFWLHICPIRNMILRIVRKIRKICRRLLS